MLSYFLLHLGSTNLSAEDGAQLTGRRCPHIRDEERRASARLPSSAQLHLDVHLAPELAGNPLWLPPRAPHLTRRHLRSETISRACGFWNLPHSQKLTSAT